jgi:hypothetical protein
MLKELKQANDLLEEAINNVNKEHPNWDIPIAIIFKELKPVADQFCEIAESDFNKIETAERNQIILEITRSHLLMDQIPSNKNKS